MTVDQNIVQIGLVLVLIAATAIAVWGLASGRFERNWKKNKKLNEENKMKYDAIVRKLEEDPQRYAIGMGGQYVINSARAHLDAVEAELQDRS